MSTPERPRLAHVLLATVLLWSAVTDLALAADAAAVGASRWLPAGSAPALGVLPTAPAGPALVFADGQGLPAGRGIAARGAELYRQQCAACHGRDGEGNSAPELVGGDGPLTRPDADKTLATYWPYASTLFDTIARAMPPAAPGRLTPDEIYSLCAFLLARNGLWSDARELDAAGLAAVRMPNRDGFDSFAPR